VPVAVLFECRPSGVGRRGCTEEKGGRREPKNRQREGNEHGKRKGKKKKKKRKGKQGSGCGGGKGCECW